MFAFKIVFLRLSYLPFINFKTKFFQKFFLNFRFSENCRNIYLKKKNSIIFSSLLLYSYKRDNHDHEFRQKMPLCLTIQYKIQINRIFIFANSDTKIKICLKIDNCKTNKTLKLFPS